MVTWRDRLNQFSGQTRFTVCRVFVHLAGEPATPLLGVLNAAARDAVDADGDLEVVGAGLAEICQRLLQLESYWQAAANEGDVFWDEGEAGDYVTDLFTDSGRRYLSEPDFSQATDDPLALPPTHHLVVMLTVAYEGEAPELETDLSQIQALRAGLGALIGLSDQDRLRAVQIHFSPARLGEELTADQVLFNFPELIPL